MKKAIDGYKDLKTKAQTLNSRQVAVAAAVAETVVEVPIASVKNKDVNVSMVDLGLTTEN